MPRAGSSAQQEVTWITAHFDSFGKIQLSGAIRRYLKHREYPQVLLQTRFLMQALASWLRDCSSIFLYGIKPIIGFVWSRCLQGGTTMLRSIRRCAAVLSPAFKFAGCQAAPRPWQNSAAADIQGVNALLERLAAVYNNHDATVRRLWESMPRHVK